MPHCTQCGIMGCGELSEGNGDALGSNGKAMDRCECGALLCDLCKRYYGEFCNMCRPDGSYLNKWVIEDDLNDSRPENDEEQMEDQAAATVIGA